MALGLFKKLAGRRLDAFERDFSYDVSYMREILEASPKAFRAFLGVMRLSRHHEGAPLEALYGAGLTAVMAEDCGPCAQLAVTMAERAGVAPAVLRAIAAGDVDALPPDAAIGVRFARAVLAHAPEADELRAEIVARWGKPAAITLAFAITASRLYPTVKYALGHGHACRRLRVGGADVAVTARAA